MVVAKIQSGLGNQMFQYAMGLATARRIGTELKLDVGSFLHGGQRQLELDRFMISAQIASEEEIRGITGILGRRNGWAARWMRQVCGRLGGVGHVAIGSYVKPKAFTFDPAALRLPDNVYLHGLWQSYRYFTDISDVVRAEFRLKTVLDEDRMLGENMASDPYSTSVHIRRGDYVTNTSALALLVCPIEYYRRAIRFIEDRVGTVHLYIFSDEPGWAAKNLCHVNARVVRLQGSDRGPRDLMLMSKCRHHIIANSTFSWWGAWLSVEKEGIVCTPKEWFKPRYARAFPTDDLLPEAWAKL